MAYKITQTNGNSTNRIRGSRISVWDSKGNLVDRFEIPTYDAQGYCKRYPGGNYAKRLNAAIEAATASSSI